MQNLIGLAEIRRNLQDLINLAEIIGPEHLAHYVRSELEEFGSIRSQIFIRTIPKEEAPPEETIATLEDEPAEPLPSVKQPPVQVRKPHRNEMPPAPGPSRRVPASTCYNAERYVPIRVLWAKVIIRAAYDYALWRDSKDMRLKKFAQDAERWLFESSNLELSFENICFAFDFPLEKIRIKTKALTKQDVKKLEFRERSGRIDLLGDTLSGNDE